ncbi:ribonuclease HII [Sphingobium vermicomposti]|uniref:Ribonuclease HII n=1 Tax=Sphingobium vermicomposti TaxID=529005 RepID=A0A846M017_9SPHN|nr:ribonuclease HII [Sphingobium vermicomposti]NIJ15272.1 ribonuclease HII [Sphingobium vermicomposti]
MPDFTHELRHHPGLVAGVDEAGRGPLAGPVVAAAVILRQEDCPDGLNDSKQLTAARRAALEVEIKARALCWGIGIASVEEIDSINILWATMLAMTRAMEALDRDCAHVLVDGNRCPQWRWASTPVVEGDAKCLSIAAASILAKEARDRMMVQAAVIHPHYGWESNKGYGSPKHLAALREHGPTPLHRRSFSPVAQLVLL